jgi:hypothetical protein
MEIKKVLFNKLFLLGVVSGIFFTVCFIGGIQYGKSLALEQKVKIISEQQEIIS